AATTTRRTAWVISSWAGSTTPMSSKDGKPDEHTAPRPGRAASRSMGRSRRATTGAARLRGGPDWLSSLAVWGGLSAEPFLGGKAVRCVSARHRAGHRDAGHRLDRLGPDRLEGRAVTGEAAAA